MRSRSNISFRIFTRGYSGGQPLRPWRFANYYWAGMFGFSAVFLLQVFSRMGLAFSAMGPLGVPIGLLEAETLCMFDAVF